jgi:hypothetical protein
MSRKRGRRARRTRRLRPANDNPSPQLSLAFIEDWPPVIEIYVEEVDLLGTYFGDLVALIAANDNEPSE